MWGPAIAAFAVAKWLSPVRDIRTTTGLRRGVPGSKWFLYYIFGLVVMPVLAVGAVFVGAALGLIHIDLANYSGYRAVLEQAAASQGTPLDLNTIPIAALVWSQLATLPFLSVINAPATFGEEYGWRGYLLPALLPLGQWPALILHGIIWGLWHAPIILMGYNYPQHPVLGVFMMLGFTTLLGIIFGWTRLATGSVWPAVLGHAAVNASAGVTALFLQAGTTVDTANATLLGWSGWILPLLPIGVLVITRQLPVRRRAEARAEEPTALPGAQAESKVA
jgi:membrane protease YdiL (CAAX protease family)